MSQQTLTDTSNPWMQYMRHGKFEEAWEFSDEVLKSRAGKTDWTLPRHFQNIWNGSPLTGRVFIRCYHGLGDTIQFVRYAPLVKEAATEVIVWAQPPLIPLLKTVQGIDTLLPLHDGDPGIDFNVDVEVMELPHIFRTTLSTIPCNIPYLHVEPAALPLKTKARNVGLIWKAGDWDEHRSMPFSFLTPLFNLKAIEFYILQSDAAAAGWKEGLGINPGEFSLFDYAGIIQSMDLIITVDSMPAHLAGAMGKPVWNLLNANADWRWMKGPGSPWYPTMRIFRQDTPGNWSSVIRQLTNELSKLAEL